MTKLFHALLVLVLVASQLPAAQVQFRGLRSVTTEELRAHLTGRMQFIAERDATPARADDAAFLVEGILRSRGFNEAIVSWSTPDAATIVLAVDEGPVFLLGEIEVPGIDEPELTEIRDQFKAAHIRAGQVVEDRVPYQPRENEEGLANVVHFLKSKGYWKAEASFGGGKRDPATGLVAVRLEVSTGPLHRLRRTVIDSAVPLDPATAGDLESIVGQPATTERIRKARKSVEGFYRAEGYQFSKVRMFAEHEGGGTTLRFEVEPGRQFVVGQVRVEGLKEVSPSRVEARVERFAGQYYDQGEVNKEVRNLLATGAFEGVFLDEYPRQDGYIDLTLRLRETKPYGYYFYGGVGSFEGVIIGAGYYHRNVFGRLYSFAGGLEYSGVGLLGEATLKNPFFLNRNDLEFSARAYILRNEYRGWVKTQAGLDFDLLWRVNRYYTLTASVENSFTVTESDGLPEEALGPDRYGLLSVGLLQRLDFRDAPIAGSPGFVAELLLEAGQVAGETPVSFGRAVASTGYYHSWTEKDTIGVGVRGGVIVPSSKTDLPIDLRFFTGGANSVRSFKEREMGPRVDGFPVGGEAFWVGNLEYIRTLAGPLRGVAFVDSGAIDNHADIFNGEQIKFAAGLGLRVDLPIGPMRIEYGYNLNREQGEPLGTFHFAFGAAF